MIACSRCGQESPQGSLHCVHCGNRLEEDGPARTVLGMPAIKPLGAAPPGKPASLLAGLPALRTKTSSPLTEKLGPVAQGSDSPQKTVVGLPLFEGTKKAPEPVDAEAPTVGMPGVTDDQIAAALAEEPAPTVAMQGLTDAQLAAPETPVVPAAVEAPVQAPAESAVASTARVVPVQPIKRDDPAHHPQRSEAQARRLGERKGSAITWVAVVAVIAGAAAAAWYFLR